MVQEDHRRVELCVPLDEAEGFAPGLTMAATLHVPARIDADGRQPILFLFPGAGYTRQYFDIRHPGYDGYSQCAHHAANGIICIAVDHLGTGCSSVPPGGLLMLHSPDPAYTGPPSLTIATMAGACAAVVRHVMVRLRAGDLDAQLPPLAQPVAIGVGQSMGSFVVTVAQAMQECFVGIALLGSSMTMTDLALKPGHRRPFRSMAAQERLAAIAAGMDMAGAFHWPDELAALVGADMDFAHPAPWRSMAVPACAGN